MKKIIQLFYLLAPLWFFSQNVLINFPDGQANYVGGNVAFYKEFHDILIENNLKPCENKNEFFNLTLIITPEKSIKYVKEPNEVRINENKCTFELAREVVKYMKKWNPAYVQGKNVAALTSFLIIPDQLFQNFKEGYDPEEISTIASYEGGISKFRNKVVQNVDISQFTFIGTFKLEVTFDIEADGKMSNVELKESTGLKEFDEMVLRSIRSIKNKWTPAKVGDVPIISKFRLPLSFKS